MLLELARREKFAGIKPDEDLDIFMKVLKTFLMCLIYLSIDYSLYFPYPVISSWRAGDQSSGGVYHEGILYMLVTSCVLW